MSIDLSKKNNTNIEKQKLSFNERKNLVEGYIKIKNSRGNPYNNELEKKNEEKKEEKKEEKNSNNDFDIIDDNEVNEIKKTEVQDEDLENNDIDIDLDGPLSKSDANLSKIKINLWEVVAISNSVKKKSKIEIMKNLVSNIVYNGLTFQDKLNDVSSKNLIIIYDKIESNFSPELLKKIQDSFIYMSYRTGLVNTSFLPGNKNKYTSDCGWGCMLRCSQMMLSRGFILKKIYDLKQNKKEINMDEIKKEIILLFYDKFLEIEKIGKNEQIFEIYKKLLKDKIEVAELIPPYSIYILTLLGQCPNVFTSDHKMISCFLKINKTLFNECIKMIHLKDGIIYKKKLYKKFCTKIESENDIKNGKGNNNYIEYKSEKYIFNKGGLIFISLRLGLHKIESLYVQMLPKLFNNLHNNIGFVSGKKKRAFYFIGMVGDKLIFADPHLNQKIETDEKKFPTYSVNDLFLMSIKELSSEITVGVAIFSKEDFLQFFLDIEWFNQICPGFIKYEE